MKDLRIGLVGAGMVSRHHLEAWRRTPGARVVAIADTDPGRARLRADEFGIDAVFGDAASLIDEARPDALDVATPVDTHAGICRLAAERGVDVLCQKPLCASRDEAADLVEAVAGRVRFMVHENWRFRPCYRRAAAWLAGERIGTPVLVRMHVESSGLVPDADGSYPALDRQPFFAGLERFLVFEVLIHHLDVLRWLFGELHVTAASLARASGAVRGEDTAVIMLDSDAGPPVLLDGTFAMPGATPVPSDSMDIIGTRGAIRLDGTQLRLTGPSPAQCRWDFDAMYAESYAGAIGEFVEGVRSGRRFETEASDNLKVLALVETVYATAGARQMNRFEMQGAAT